MNSTFNHELLMADLEVDVSQTALKSRLQRRTELKYMYINNKLFIFYDAYHLIIVLTEPLLYILLNFPLCIYEQYIVCLMIYHSTL